MIQSIILPQPPTTNETIRHNRTNRFKGANLKRKWTKAIASECRYLTPYDTSVWIAVDITYPRANCDPDNLFGCLKYVLDGLVKAGVLKSDNAKWVNSPIHYSFTKDPERRVTLYLFDSYAEFSLFVSENVRQGSI